MSKIDDNCREAQPQQVEKMLRKMTILHLIHASQSKEKAYGGYMKSIGDRLGRWEKTKQGNLGLDKSKMRHILLLHRWVQDP